MFFSFVRVRRIRARCHVAVDAQGGAASTPSEVFAQADVQPAG